MIVECGARGLVFHPVVQRHVGSGASANVYAVTNGAPPSATAAGATAAAAVASASGLAAAAAAAGAVSAPAVDSGSGDTKHTVTTTAPATATGGTGASGGAASATAAPGKPTAAVSPASEPTAAVAAAATTAAAAAAADRKTAAPASSVTVAAVAPPATAASAAAAAALAAAAVVGGSGFVVKHYNSFEVQQFETTALRRANVCGVPRVPLLLAAAYPFALMQGLGQAVQRRDRLSAGDYQALVDTLQRLHQSAGRVHCDVRFSNIVMIHSAAAATLLPVLIDFHCAVKIGDPVTGSGTPLCAADDQFAARMGDTTLTASAALDLQALVRVAYVQVRGVRRLVTGLKGQRSDAEAAPALLAFWRGRKFVASDALPNYTAYEFADPTTDWAKLFAAATRADYATVKQLLTKVAPHERD